MESIGESKYPLPEHREVRLSINAINCFEVSIFPGLIGGMDVFIEDLTKGTDGKVANIFNFNPEREESELVLKSIFADMGKRCFEEISKHPMAKRL